MPIARFQMADGKIGRFEVPEGTTPENAQALIESHLSEQTSTEIKAPEQGDASGPVTAAINGVNTAVPFGRKITSGIGAYIAKAASPITGDERSLRDLYDQAELDSAATAEANPKSTIAGTVAGIAATLPLASARVIAGGPAATQGLRGVANAIPNQLGRVADFARGGSNLAANATRGAIVAAPTGALYGAGEADTGDELSGAAKGAGVAAGVGAALPVGVASAVGLGTAGRQTIRGIGARGEEALEASGDAIRNVSNRAYQAMRDEGAIFTPESSRNLIGTIDRTLRNDGPLNQGLHGTTMSILDDLRTASSQEGFGLEELDQYRRLLSRVPRTTPEDARKASIVIESLDNAVNDLSVSDLANGTTRAIDALNTGRREYARYSKFSRISDIVNNSGGDANKLKRDLEKFASNPKLTRGFSPAEMAALRDAARNTTTEGLLKMAGKFGIDLGSSRSAGNAGLPAILGAIGLNAGAAGLGGVGTAGATVVGGTVARLGQKMIARGKVEQLLQTIEQGGRVAARDLGDLPPDQAQIVFDAIRNQAGRAPVYQDVAR